MQNEFEKQVRERMEELDLVPSEPVWEKIAEQIRKKKDRRRVILWLPLLCLFLAGGTWWLNNGEDPAVRKEQATAAPVNSAAKNTKDLPGTVKYENVPSHPSSENTKETTGKETTGTPVPGYPEILPVQSPAISGGRDKSNPAFLQHTEGRSKKAPGRFTTKGGIPDKQPIAKNTGMPLMPVQAEADHGIMETPAVQTKNSQGKHPQADRIEKSNPAVAVNVNTSRTDSATSKKDVSPAADKKTDSVNSSPNAQPAPQPKKPWKFGFAVAGGVGGISNGLNLFGGAKSMADATPLAMPSTGMYYFDESPEQKRGYFSVAGVITRSIGRKFSLSSGIGYNQYSTSLVVGRRIDSNMRTGLYSNQFANMGIGMQDYINRFHFISVPLGIEMRAFKKLNVHADMMVQYLLASNALDFNFSAQQYYHDLNHYRRTQLSALFGLEYALLDKKHTLLAGPQLQYSVTPHEKDDLNKRLFSYGLKARFLFQKK